MNYDKTLTIRVPLSLADIAANIGRALDPDTGGERSFSRQVIGTGEDGEPLLGNELVCSTLCTTSFYHQALMMISDAAMLHAAVTADYAARWPDLTAPSLEDCTAFVNQAVIDLPPPESAE